MGKWIIDCLWGAINITNAIRAYIRYDAIAAMGWMSAAVAVVAIMVADVRIKLLQDIIAMLETRKDRVDERETQAMQEQKA